MKKLAFLLSSICFVLILFSCESDPCEDKNCGEFGVCNEGVCICEDFYEGDNCEKEVREKYVGSWSGDFDCGYTTGTDLMFEITPGVEVQTIRIRSNQIYGGTEFIGTILEDNSVEILRTQSGLNFLSGDIEDLGGDRIKMTINQEASDDKCTFALLRQ